MSEPELIITARWIIPVEPAGVALEGHALVVGAGRILQLLPAPEALAAWPACRRVDRPHHALLPGLVNAHTHAAMTLLRGFADDLPLETWLRDHIWPAEARWVSDEFVRAGTDLALLEMLQGGTTCLGDMYLFPDAVAAAVAASGLRAVIGMVALEMPTAWAPDATEYLRKGMALRDQFRGHPRIGFMFAPHAPYTVSDATLERIRVLADELDAPIQMHVHETVSEAAGDVFRPGMRPLQRLDDLGLLSPLLSAVHMTQLLPEEIELLSAHGTHVVHCPESNLKLASGTCPVTELLDAGVNVALGTDGAASNNDLDLWSEMRTAALVAKGASGRADALPAATVLRMATLNGARALGLGERIGSLERGKDADVICVDLSAAATRPVHNPISQLVYATSRTQVSDVWVQGELLLEDFRPARVNDSAICGTADRWGERIRRGT